MGEWASLKSDFLLTLLKKIANLFFSLEDANILKSYHIQYSKQVHKILAFSDEKNYYFFFLLYEKVNFQENIVGKRVPLPHFSITKIMFLMLLDITYIFYKKKRIYFEIYPREMMLLHSAS